MAPIERWYKKWEALSDSDDNVTDQLAPAAARHLPQDIATSLSQAGAMARSRGIKAT